MGFLYTVAAVILVLIIVFLIIRLIRQKPKKSVRNHKWKKNDTILRNISYVCIAIGAALLGGSIIWGMIDPISMDPIAPMKIGAPIFLFGLMFLIGFYIQKLVARNKEYK